MGNDSSAPEAPSAGGRWLGFSLVACLLTAAWAAGTWKSVRVERSWRFTHDLRQRGLLDKAGESAAKYDFGLFSVTWAGNRTSWTPSGHKSEDWQQGRTDPYSHLEYEAWDRSREELADAIGTTRTLAIPLLVFLLLALLTSCALTLGHWLPMETWKFTKALLTTELVSCLLLLVMGILFTTCGHVGRFAEVHGRGADTLSSPQGISFWLACAGSALGIVLGVVAFRTNLERPPAVAAKPEARARDDEEPASPID